MRKIIVSLIALLATITAQADVVSATRLLLQSSTLDDCEIRIVEDNAASSAVTGIEMNMQGRALALYIINGTEKLQTATASVIENLPLGFILDNGNEFTLTVTGQLGTPMKIYDAHTTLETELVLNASINITAASVLTINRTADTQELPSSLGTFVSDKKVASVTGAVLYEIIATDGVSNITFQEVNMTNGLAAGTPVLYQKTDATAFVTFTDDAPINGVYAYANGFVGLLPGNNSKEEHMGVGDLWALVSDGKLKFVDTYCTLTPGHAYINMNAINPQQPAPGRRRLMIGRSGIVTDVENVAAEVKGARKSIENGKIVILKNGQKYNVAGQMMK